MAGNYRKSTEIASEEIPFQIEVEGKTFSGTLTPSGKVLPLGVPSAFVVRI
jgi:hypothetical protein